VLEATIVLETRRGDAGGREFDLWLLKIGAEVVSVDADINRRGEGESIDMDQ